ncbi:hypothetical protein [Anatilimnocola floriformis]|uniref:hypothetical protein n=1 Tax=Anatilimnocola floriformis TaxID=2948575 RepID=UPI0020C594AE|nr:hypothetical protein [Anatilimnocola floriformis]
MFVCLRTAVLFLIAAVACVGQVSAAEKILSSTVLADNAQQGKYTFVLFYKANDAATTAMNTELHQALAKHPGKGTVAFVHVADPAERALITKYDVARAPMPMTLAIAPNGAMTGIFGQKLEAANVDSSFVTPTMMQVMKGLQENKLVFVTVNGSANNSVPTSLREFQADPHFGQRMIVLTMNAADPAEARFVAEMEVDPRAAGTQLSLLAPPGVLVGRFPANTPKNNIAAALAEAGKCCDDPNCKHHQGTNGAAAPSAATKR